MIRFDEMESNAWTAMCSPIDLVLPSEERSNHGALYIGTWIASMDSEILDSHQIDNILSIIDEEMMVRNRSDGRGTHRIVLSDSTTSDIRPHLDGACRYISAELSKGENVLVHCHQGISRSASIIIAYLMRERQLSYDAAFDFLKEKRKCVKPNVEFERTLRLWGKSSFKHINAGTHVKPNLERAKLFQRTLSNSH